MAEMRVTPSDGQVSGPVRFGPREQDGRPVIVLGRVT